MVLHAWRLYEFMIKFVTSPHRNELTKQKMSESRTVKYHIPQQGVYLYAHVEDGKTEMIVLNSTDSEQTVLTEHYNVLTKGAKLGREI